MVLVTNLLEKFGVSAGKIWEKLSETELQPEAKLRRKTGLNKEEFYGAIGWLAREDKIRRKGRSYALGDTNLIGEVGANAGRIWKTLNIWGELDLPNLARLADLNDKELFTALGWLAREGKVESDPSLRKWRLK
ncbi:MAG TPA: hypothetical protein ENI42_00765 [Thermoplasmatales archaeon]|nr:hypothetical protein [Thermoplasmatales archaeon]